MTPTGQPCHIVIDAAAFGGGAMERAEQGDGRAIGRVHVRGLWREVTELPNGRYLVSGIRGDISLRDLNRLAERYPSEWDPPGVRDDVIARILADLGEPI